MVGGDGSPLRLYEVVLKVSEEKEHAPLTSGCSVPPSRFGLGLANPLGFGLGLANLRR